MQLPSGCRYTSKQHRRLHDTLWLRPVQRYLVSACISINFVIFLFENTMSTLLFGLSTGSAVAFGIVSGSVGCREGAGSGVCRRG